MPQLFSKRFLAQLERPNPEAQVAFAEGWHVRERGDLAGAEDALRITIKSRTSQLRGAGPVLGLAGIEEQDKRYATTPSFSTRRPRVRGTR